MNVSNKTGEESACELDQTNAHDLVPQQTGCVLFRDCRPQCGIHKNWCSASSKRNRERCVLMNVSNKTGEESACELDQTNAHDLVPQQTGCGQVELASH